MKFTIPEISWHNRDPVLSVDFQPKTDENGLKRLATGGTDSHVLIWYISTTETGAVNLEVAADLTRHQKAVNVVRWSPSGQLLASGDDESIIFIWKQKFEKEPASNLEQPEEQYKESWVIHKTLRGHMEDVLDLSWSPDSLYLASGSVDNKLLIWDVTRGRYSCILSDHKGFVQGVCWDPKGQLVATTSTDRTFRTFDVTTKKVTSRSSKAILPFPSGHSLHDVKVRLYHDDTLQTFYRRLAFSPDGLLIAVPGGRIEPEQGKMEEKPINAVYIYTRYSLKVLTDLTWSPDCLTLVASSTDGFCSVITFADGELGEEMPDDELIQQDKLTGAVEVQAENKQFETPKEKTESTPKEKVQDVKSKEKQESKSTTPKIDSFIKFKAPSKSQKTVAQPKTPVKIDVLEETAMPSWSDNSSNEIIRPKDTVPMEVDNPEITVIEDSEDIKLVYEETEGPKSPKTVSPKDLSNNTSPENAFLKTAKVTDVKQAVQVKAAPSPKAPRRVNFVTLSSPKNKKKW